MKNCIDPLGTTNLSSDCLINIYSGKIATKNVNVHDSVNIGNSQLKAFAGKRPEGFYEPISKKVTTMTISKKCLKVNDVPVHDTEVIFSRIMCLLSTGDIDLKETLRNYELPPLQLQFLMMKEVI